MAAKKKGKPYITVETRGGKEHTVDHASKKAAHVYGQAARREGRTIFAHSKDTAAKHGLDPRAANRQLNKDDHAARARIASAKLQEPLPRGPLGKAITKIKTPHGQNMRQREAVRNNRRADLQSIRRKSIGTAKALHSQAGFKPGAGKARSATKSAPQSQAAVHSRIASANAASKKTAATLKKIRTASPTAFSHGTISTAVRGLRESKASKKHYEKVAKKHASNPQKSAYAASRIQDVKKDLSFHKAALHFGRKNVAKTARPAAQRAGFNVGKKGGKFFMSGAGKKVYLKRK